MSLTPNTAAKRFAHIAKLYGDKHPDVVLDTFMVLADTVGIESPWREWKWARRWDDMGIGARGNSGQTQRRLVHEALRDLADDPRMQQRHASDPLWPWLARELVRMKKQDLQAADGRRPLGAVLAMTDTVDDGLRGLGTVLSQWQKAERIDLNRWSLLDAMEAVKEFESARRGPLPQGDVVYEWPDGWTMQLLLPPPELRDESESEYEEALEAMLEAEGEVMQHCVGAGAYFEPSLYGQAEIYSLRDPRGQPHATVEYDSDLHRVWQIQGKQNREPIPEYLARVNEWLGKSGFELRPLDTLSEEERQDAEAFGREHGELALEGLLESSQPVTSFAGISAPGRILADDVDEDLVEHVWPEVGIHRLWDHERLLTEAWGAANEAGREAVRRGADAVYHVLFETSERITTALAQKVEGGRFRSYEEAENFVEEAIANASVREADRPYLRDLVYRFSGAGEVLRDFAYDLEEGE